MTTGGPSEPRPRRRPLLPPLLGLLAVVAVAIGVAVAVLALRPDDDATADAADVVAAEGSTGAGHDHEAVSRHPSHDEHVAVVPPTGVTRSTARSGPWSDAGTWVDGARPQPGDAVVVGAGHDVVLDADAAVDGLQIAGGLSFDPARPVTVDTTASVVVTGTLTMEPGDPATDHLLRFTGIDTARFHGVDAPDDDDDDDGDSSASEDDEGSTGAEAASHGHGGGDASPAGQRVDASLGGTVPHQVGDPATDVGLWVIEGGQLRLEGAPRTGWTNAVAGIPAGADTIEVVDASGWRVGDEIAIAPTAAPEDYTNPTTTYDGFHETTIAAIDGNTVTLSEPTTRAHDQVDGRWTAEVMNLTRNVRVEGTAHGHAHVLVHTTGGPQLIRYAALRHLGVPDVLGRYPLHFHHAGDSSRGSLVEGVVVRQGGHHAFVPHTSHGITMRDLVAYDIGGGDAFWWDQGDVTNDLLMEHVIAARTTDSGFFLGMGWNMTLRDAVSVGIGNLDGNVAGFEWENGANGLWVFEDTVAHNNDNRGIRVWQNSANPQVIDRYAAYHNTGPGIEHGAYTNRYLYRDIDLYGNRGGGIILQAVSRSSPDEPIDEPGIEFKDMVIDAAGVAVDPHFLVQGSAIPADQPVVLRDVTFRGTTGGPVIHFLESSQHQLRCIRCSVGSDGELVRFTQPYAPEATWLELLAPDGSVRFRPVDVDPGAKSVSSDGGEALWRAPLDVRVPPASGKGTGLKVEYFDDAGLRQPRFTTLLTYPLEYYWPEFGTPYPTVDTSDGAGVRLTGQVEVEAGQGGRYEFLTVSGGGVRLWVDGKLVVDDPRGDGTEQQTGSIELAAGRRYDLRMEVYDHEGGTDYFLYGLVWTRPDGHREVVPVTQLHPAPGIPSNAPAVTALTP